MSSKFYFLATVGLLAQIFFGVPSGAAVPTIPSNWDIKKIEATTPKSDFGKFIILNDVLLYEDYDTKNTINCYEKESYETLIENFIINWKKAVAKYGAYLDCRYGERYRKAEGCLKYIIDTIEGYPIKLESWLNGSSSASLGPSFPPTPSTISLCDFEVTTNMKAMLKEVDKAPRKFYELVDNSRKEAKDKGKVIMKKIADCIRTKTQ